MTSRIAAVAFLALAGLFLAAGVTFAASRLVSQPIGLSYHQRSLDDSLAPAKTITVTRTITTIGSAKTTQTTSAAPVPSSGSGSATVQAPARITTPKAKSDSRSPSSQSDSSASSGGGEPYADGHNDGDHDD